MPLLPHILCLVSLFTISPSSPNSALLQPKNFDCVARAVFGEARDQGEQGMALVAQSIANRHALTGRSVCDIAERAYEGYRRWEHQDPTSVNLASWQQSQIVTIRVILGVEDLGSCASVTHFLNPTDVKRKPRWANRDNRVCRVKDHVGYAVANI